MITIRLANANLDTNDEVDKIHLCNKQNLPIFYEPGTIKYFINSDHHLIIVAHDNKTNNIIGYTICQINKTVIHILSIGINKEWRNNGIP